MKFLLDENVKKELLKFLKQKGFDVVFKPKELSNGTLAEFSKLEQRVLISNDRHFTNSPKFSKEKIFSVVWLRIPQDKPEILLNKFSELLDKIKPEEFKGKFIILHHFCKIILVFIKN